MLTDLLLARDPELHPPFLPLTLLHACCSCCCCSGVFGHVVGLFKRGSEMEVRSQPQPPSNCPPSPVLLHTPGLLPQLNVPSRASRRLRMRRTLCCA